MTKQYSLRKLTPEIQHAYKFCQTVAKQHYENFPVASWLLPRHLRRSVAAIYAFARTADDIADEEEMPVEVRLDLMSKFETKLYDLQYGKSPDEPIFIALKHTIECFNLPFQLFYDLLTAFRQDILKNRYKNFNEVKDYSHYSANPIGRLLLLLAGQGTRENLLYADFICTGLQLINFIQDVEIDLHTKNRCYIPTDDLEAFNITLDDIAARKAAIRYKQLIDAQIRRAREIFVQGLPLCQHLPGFFAIEIAFIINCGIKVLDKLAKRDNVWQRPVITKANMAWLFVITLCRRQVQPYEHSIPILLQ